jgi:hyaluronan synthase
MLNEWTELIHHRLSLPYLSRKGQVTVLGGRCVAYLRSAALPLLDGLAKEKFLGKQCVAGDDGRMTSLLLSTGWKTVYQSTARFKTISPETYLDLLRQRLRWFRNGTRRTLRTFLTVPERQVAKADRLWVWKHPRAL